MIVMVILGGLAITKSGAAALRFALVLFLLRLVADFAYVPSTGMRDRFLSMQMFYDICMIAYCWFRVRTLSKAR